MCCTGVPVQPVSMPEINGHRQPPTASTQHHHVHPQPHPRLQAHPQYQGHHAGAQQQPRAPHAAAAPGHAHRMNHMHPMQHHPNGITGGAAHQQGRPVAQNGAAGGGGGAGMHMLQADPNLVYNNASIFDDLPLPTSIG